MHILYVNGHPDANSFHTLIQRRYVDALRESPHEVRVLELGAQHFDPVLRYGYHRHMPEDEEISAAQESLKWADHVVFAFPVWWGDAPALMKGWIERVFAPGVTYRFHGIGIEHLLTGTTADIIATQRGVRPLAWIFGNHFIGIFRHNLFALTGIKLKHVLTLGAVGLGGRLDTRQRRDRFLNKVEHLATSMRDRGTRSVKSADLSVPVRHG